MIAFTDPFGAPTQLAGWREPHAPVVAVLVPAVNRIASEHHNCRHAGQRPEGS
jgi:hypothetical protein